MKGSMMRLGTITLSLAVLAGCLAVTAWIFRTGYRLKN